MKVDETRTKSNLLRLLDRAAAGEEIIILRAGHPIARLVAMPECKRRPGIASHWNIPDDLFLEPADPEDLDAAEGKHTDEFGITIQPFADGEPPR